MNLQVEAKVKAMNKANAVGWARARLLCEQVPDTNTNQARGFLSANKQSGYQEILDSRNLDKRNPVVRTMLQGFQEYCKTNAGRIGRKPSNGEIPTPTMSRSDGADIIPRRRRRRSQGDSTRAPRAGAPVESDLMSSLIKIKELSEELGGLKKLEEGIEIIKGLQLPTT